MTIPPPPSPKPMSRDSVLQNQANNRWEHHKLTGWKGPDPPVRVQPQIPPISRSSGGAWKRGGTLHSVPSPRLPVTPIPKGPQAPVRRLQNVLMCANSLGWNWSEPKVGNLYRRLCTQAV